MLPPRCHLISTWPAGDYSWNESVGAIGMPCPEDSVSLHPTPFFGSYILPPPPLSCSPGRGIRMDVPVRTECSVVTYLFSARWSVLSLPNLLTTAERGFPGRGWGQHWFMDEHMLDCLATHCLGFSLGCSWGLTVDQAVSLSCQAWTLCFFSLGCTLNLSLMCVFGASSAHASLRIDCSSHTYQTGWRGRAVLRAVLSLPLPDRALRSIVCLFLCWEIRGWEEIWMEKVTKDSSLSGSHSVLDSWRFLGWGLSWLLLWPFLTLLKAGLPPNTREMSQSPAMSISGYKSFHPDALS